MFDTLPVAAGLAAAFTVGGFAITRTGRYAAQATVILAAVATGLGMLALIGGLARLDARGPSVSRADARPDYGMSWRPTQPAPADRLGARRGGEVPCADAATASPVPLTPR